MNTVAVFGIPAGNAGIALTSETADYIKKIFHECGRFMPAGNKQVEDAFREAAESSGGNIYIEAAKILNADIYVTETVYQVGEFIYLSMDIVPVNTEFNNLKRKIRLKSKLKLNIPIKAGMEIALMHRSIPVRSEIVRADGNGVYLINAGEWHGIISGKNYKTDDSIINIIQAGRFESLAKITKSGHEGDPVIIKIYPKTGKLIDDLNQNISRNTIARYSLDENSAGSEKRLLEGICLINIGSNVCLPGYGSFLSTEYLGFDKSSPDWTGVVFYSSLITTHFILPEIMTGFKINFFPWEKDPDKTWQVQDLQKFLWISLPLTFSASYLDQLAFQFTNHEYLPPFFNDKDNMASVFSLFIPGGGAFYKGHRMTGWSYYFSEMILSGYYIYHRDEDRSNYFLYGLAAVKAIDIVHAYLMKPGYSFYNLETERNKENVTLDFGFNKITDDDIMTLSVTAKFH